MAKDTTIDPVTGEIEVPRELRDDDSGHAAPSKRHEVLGVVTVVGALFLLLSLVTYGGMSPDGVPIKGANLLGPAGTWTAYFSITILGLAVYLLDALAWIYAGCLFTGRSRAVGPKAILGLMVVAVFASVILYVALAGEQILGGHSAGGFVGQLLGEISMSLVSSAGTYIIAGGGILTVLLLVTDISIVAAVRGALMLAVRGARSLGGLIYRVAEAWRHGPEAADEAITEEDAGGPTLSPVPDPEDDDKAKGKQDEPPAPVEPKIVTKDTKKEKKKKKKKDKKELVIDQSALAGEFQLPTLDLLTGAPPDGGDPDAKSEIDQEHLKRVADRLVSVLADFAVYGDVLEIHPGPVVTMYEFQPRSGTKLSKIGSLSSEIAMALEVKKVRVVAPIPGKNAVGFELPNEVRETVFLKEMLEDEAYSNSKAKLPMALGKNIIGSHYVADLAKMPHLLIAGTTGSGKSVSVNAVLLSMLYRHTPEDLRLLLIDPKMIELGIYDGIPHLLLPVVTDMNKACLALKWAVDEMERRYQLFADKRVRNLDSYNRKVKKELETWDEDRAAEALEATSFADEHGNEPQFEEKKKPEKLPTIVIIIDELADLMMVAAKDVETSITRLAQKARAAGLHLIVATQRPSTDVITGLIKANFPARISFRVSSGIDSRTILGTIGAENLLGRGDMLVIPPGTSDLKRVHGAYVDEAEIRDIVDFLKQQADPNYHEEILAAREDEGGGAISDEEKDEVYDQAVAIVAEAQTCSISMLQRRLRIGYNRSARIVEIMEKEGVVGPANHQNKREVLVGPQ